jgi:hypothetical protein
MSNFFDIPSLVRAKLREARLARTAAAAILFLPALCHAVDTGSTAYRSGKAAAYVVGGLLLFFLARRLLGGLAWARWLIVPESAEMEMPSATKTPVKPATNGTLVMTARRGDTRPPIVAR